MEKMKYMNQLRIHIIENVCAMQADKIYKFENLFPTIDDKNIKT